MKQILDVKGESLFINTSFDLWKNFKCVGIGGPGWIFQKELTDGVLIKFVGTAKWLEKTLPQKKLLKEIEKDQVELSYKTLRIELMKMEMKLDIAMEELNSAIAERDKAISERNSALHRLDVDRRDAWDELRKAKDAERTAKEKLKKTIDVTNEKIKEAFDERDHAQSHVRWICSELLRRDANHHAKKFLKRYASGSVDTETK